MRKGLVVAFAIASFVGVQTASADCRNEFKDCRIRKGSGTAARSLCTKTYSLCWLHARQAAHQAAKVQHDVVAAPKAAVTNAAKTKTVGPGAKQSSK